jgi:hypothetical protein
MLNELFELDNSRQEARIKVPSWHKHYGPCPKYRTFQVLLDAAGSVAAIEPVRDIGRITSFRKWEISNGTSFPAFNILPIFHASSESAREHLADLRKWLGAQEATNQEAVRMQTGQVWDACEQLWAESEFDRINRCLQSHPASLAVILGVIPEELACLGNLIERAALLDAHRLRESIERIATQQMAESPGGAKDWLDTLLVSAAPKRGSARKVSLVLELADRSKYPYPACHEKVQVWINSRLLAHETSEGAAQEPSIKDAFGCSLSATKEKFPDVNLPKLGSVKLRAMSSEIPCQRRYGAIDAESFPAALRVRQTMKDSLEWLGDVARRRKTWEDVSEACAYDAGLLFVYPTLVPSDPPELAGLFVPEESGAGDEARFEAAAARVTPALHGIVNEHPEAEIRVFVLAKADKARTKLLVSEKYNARYMIDAAQAWKDGCNNVPIIRLNLGTKEKPNWIEPLSPFPSEFVQCLNVAWLRGGTRTDSVHNAGIGEAISLLMESGAPAERLAQRTLGLLLTTASQLLLALGHADHRRDGEFKLPARFAKHATLLPSVLGLLLAKLRCVKGDYMHSAPFLVGRMLALADTLHKEYCRHVRKKEVPPQLIGNALMPAAMDNPERGLARLTERLMIYQAWANKAQGDEYRLAKWTLGQFGLVSSELAKLPIPVRANDADKAQMLLGYLARFGGKTPEESATESATDPKEVTNVQ